MSSSNPPPVFEKHPLEGPILHAMSCGKAVYLVVLLDHPGAADAKLIDIAINWQPAMLKSDFLLAESPFPGGQWFESEGKSEAEILEGLDRAAAELNPFIDEMLARRRLDDSHLALVGFSQGADLALHVALRRKKAPGAVVAFSGLHYLPQSIADAASKPDMLLVHGDADPVAPLDVMTRAKEALKAQDVPVKSMTRKGTGHMIDDDAVMGCDTFLPKTMIKPKKPKIDPADYDHPDAHAHDAHDHDHEHDDHDHDHDHDHAH